MKTSVSLSIYNSKIRKLKEIKSFRFPVELMFSFNLANRHQKENYVYSVYVSNVTTAIFFENIRRYCSDVQRFLSSASSPNFGRIEDRATDEEKRQPKRNESNEKAEGKTGGMAEYSSRTELQWLVTRTSKRTLI